MWFLKGLSKSSNVFFNPVNASASSNTIGPTDAQAQQQQQQQKDHVMTPITSHFIKDYCTSESARSAVARQESEMLRMAEESQHVIISQMLNKLHKRKTAASGRRRSSTAVVAAVAEAEAAEEAHTSEVGSTATNTEIDVVKDEEEEEDVDDDDAVFTTTETKVNNLKCCF